MNIRQKKSLGQHFLNDEALAQQIVDSLSYSYPAVVEVGVGKGILTKYLIDKNVDFWVVELDDRLAEWIEFEYPELKGKVIHQDILKVKFEKYFTQPFAIIGNFPYNISSQILFKILDYKDQIPEMVGMFQKEVAQRIAADHGNKQYGILSVLIQVHYDVEYLFQVDENKFVPPPKVKSAVIRLSRKEHYRTDYNEHDLKKVVKTAFNQRRKTLRNALKPLVMDKEMLSGDLFNLRAEQLSVDEFIDLTNYLFKEKE